MFVKTLMLMRKVFIILLVIIPLASWSQYKVLMLSGDSMNIRNFKYNETGTAITFHSKSRELQEIELENIFSITDTLKNEQVIYKPDTLKEDYMTVAQMRSFIRGEIEADLKYKCNWCFIGGIATGAASPFLLPFIGIKPVVYSPLLPAASSSAIGFTGASLKTISRINPVLVKDPHFVNGFKERSGQIKLKTTIIGSGIGLVAGILTAIVLQQTGAMPK